MYEQVQGYNCTTIIKFLISSIQISRKHHRIVGELTRKERLVNLGVQSV